MPNEHRYILASNRTPKLNCPKCNAKKHWQRYINCETGEILPVQYGRCDNVSKCGFYSLPPLETLCFYVPIEGIKEISKIAYAIIQDEKSIAIPKATIFEKSENGIYISEYFLKDVKKKSANMATIKFDETQRKYYSSNGIVIASVQNVTKPQRTLELVFFPVEVFKQTLQPERYEHNTFIQNLMHRIQFPFDPKDIEKVISLYYLGTVTNGYRAGANTFPFIDKYGNIRAIQVKQFNEDNHITGTDFLHSIIEKHHTRNNKTLPEWLEKYIKQEKMVSCLFGEHLLKKYPLNPVALVEAPKTAVYCTLYFGFPETIETPIWLAVYNKSSLSIDKLKVLQGRDIFTFPDLSKDGNTFSEWMTKAKEIENKLPGTRFIFSDLLEQLAPETDKFKGNDIADYLIKQDWRLFRKQNFQEQPKPIAIESCEKCEKCEDPNKPFFSQQLETAKMPVHLFRFMEDPSCIVDAIEF